jgi:hypothetical protein
MPLNEWPRKPIIVEPQGHGDWEKYLEEADRLYAQEASKTCEHAKCLNVLNVISSALYSPRLCDEQKKEVMIAFEKDLAAMEVEKRHRTNQNQTLARGSYADAFEGQDRESFDNRVDEAMGRDSRKKAPTPVMLAMAPLYSALGVQAAKSAAPKKRRHRKLLDLPDGPLETKSAFPVHAANLTGLTRHAAETAVALCMVQGVEKLAHDDESRAWLALAEKMMRTESFVRENTRDGKRQTVRFEYIRRDGELPPPPSET